MCQCLGVKRANYYKWLHHERSQFDKRWNLLIETVRAYHETYDHKLGYRMMKDYINHDSIYRISGLQSNAVPGLKESDPSEKAQLYSTGKRRKGCTKCTEQRFQCGNTK